LLTSANKTQRPVIRMICKDSKKSWQKITKKNTTNFCENGKNHGKITASNYGLGNHYKVYKT